MGLPKPLLSRFLPRSWLFAAGLSLLSRCAFAGEVFDAFSWKPSSGSSRSYEKLQERYQADFDSGQIDALVCGRPRNSPAFRLGMPTRTRAPVSSTSWTRPAVTSGLVQAAARGPQAR